jgi:hypothetical protein
MGMELLSLIYRFLIDSSKVRKTGARALPFEPPLL